MIAFGKYVWQTQKMFVLKYVNFQYYDIISMFWATLTPYNTYKVIHLRVESPHTLLLMWAFKIGYLMIFFFVKEKSSIQ